jgi:predicted metal-binding membrane protein
MPVTAALVFAASAVGTVYWCGSMQHMPGMAMPGGWTMSMAWMRMPGQGWIGAGTTFTAMWALMMVAMMMPVLLPELRGLRTRAAAVFAAGYFGVWTATGLLIFPFGIAYAELAMRSESVSRATPWLTAITVISAGALQFTRWKSRLLACCHGEHRGCDAFAHGHASGSVLRAGARLGQRCVYCCANLTAVLLVMGVMDLRAMALTTMAISAERLMPAGGVTPRMIGVALLMFGATLLVRAMPVITF